MWVRAGIVVHVVGMYEGGIKIGYMCVGVWVWFCVAVGVSMYEGEGVRVLTSGNGLTYEKLPKMHIIVHPIKYY